MKEFTWSELKAAANNDSGPAYVVIQEKVYEVTDFQKLHPGGKVILSQRGLDASDAFYTFHQESTWEMLANFYVGDVVDKTMSPPSEFTEEIKSILATFEESGLMKADKLAHDFAHHQVFKNRFYNDCVTLLLGNVFQGFSLSWWKDKHNTHHSVPNVHNGDPDIDTMPFLAWSEHALDLFSDMSEKSIAMIKYQAHYYFPLLSMARLSWVYQSHAFVLDNANSVPYRTLEKIGLILHWIWYFSLSAYYLNWFQGLIFFMLSQSICGFLLAICFSLNHNGMPVFEKSEVNEKDFYLLQVLTGRDVTPSIWITWLTGGLNFQIEHHICPKVPRHNLPKLAALIRPLCAKYNIPYHQTSFIKGTMEVVERLQKVINTKKHKFGKSL